MMPSTASREAQAASRQVGFFTDTTLCIGCKACEVACKQWNQLPDDGFRLTGMSFDNTGQLGASTWRHVEFIERPQPLPGLGSPRDGAQLDGGAFSWLMMSDVCKHCERAGCLEACPTGAILRTEFGSVYVQPDVCNGCGYCVSACPFGVIDRREDDGRAWKCTLCYDRLKDDREPACAQACPTDSIQFGELDVLHVRAEKRLQTLTAAGQEEARLYLADSNDGVGGAGAFFLLLDEPEVYGLPPDPVATTRDLGSVWAATGAAAVALGAGIAAAVLGGRRR